ncbi:hypothetical protein EDC04DRAFT_2570711 [Pisolithus marmoratus]|nr:hypothetical protein EDC04DRAFT_2570711 [Pisolithus marmoratus]
MVDSIGSLDLLPTWFQQGHGVSSLLKDGREKNGACGWVDQASNFHALLFRILSIIHLQMYAVGHDVLVQLNEKAKCQQDMDMQSILPIWNSIYNNMSIMVNCATPYHTDINGQEPWLDMLVMVGNYMLLNFIIPTLNLCLEYNPGTIIAMSDSALEHGVEYHEGNHTCLAYYMQENVHQSVGIPLCQKPNIMDLKP